MQYKTVVGPANTIDNDVNHLAAEGWLVHSFIVTGVMDLETNDEQVVMEMPILSYLMMRETPATEQEGGRPVRKVLGRAQ